MKPTHRLAAPAGWLILVIAAIAFELQIGNNEILFGAPISKWLLFLVFAVATPLVLGLIRSGFCSILKRWERVQAEEKRLGEDAVKGLSGSSALLVVATAWRLLIEPLELPHPTPLEHGADLALIVGAVWLILGLWDAICQRISDRAVSLDTRAERLLIPLIRKFVRGIIVVVGALVALGAFAVDWKSMIAGLGLGGLLVALAAKDSVENLFGSVTILFDMPFQIGDLVKVSGIEGTVEEINLRSTRIRTTEDAVVTLPNSNLIKASVENFGARRKRRQRLVLHVKYQTSTDKLEKLMRRTRQYLETQPWVVGDVVVQLQEFGETSISVLVLFFVTSESYGEEMAHRGEVIRRILAAAEELEVHFLP